MVLKFFHGAWSYFFRHVLSFALFFNKICWVSPKKKKKHFSEAEKCPEYGIEQISEIQALSDCLLKDSLFYTYPRLVSLVILWILSQLSFSFRFPDFSIYVISFSSIWLHYSFNVTKSKEAHINDVQVCCNLRYGIYYNQHPHIDFIV